MSGKPYLIGVYVNNPMLLKLKYQFFVKADSDSEIESQLDQPVFMDSDSQIGNLIYLTEC